MTSLSCQEILWTFYKILGDRKRDLIDYKGDLEMV
jgi:hypothetical protein